MNDKVEVEIAKYLNRNMLNRIQNDDTIEGFTTIEAGDLAQHFYNLALEDVKKEVIRRRDDFDRVARKCQPKSDSAFTFCVASNEDSYILDLIDNQKQ